VLLRGRWWLVDELACRPEKFLQAKPLSRRVLLEIRSGAATGSVLRWSSRRIAMAMTAYIPTTIPKRKRVPATMTLAMMASSTCLRGGCSANAASYDLAREVLADLVFVGTASPFVHDLCLLSGTSGLG
jgi:hypothetical protein